MDCLFDIRFTRSAILKNALFVIWLFVLLKANSEFSGRLVVNFPQNYLNVSFIKREIPISIQNGKLITRLAAVLETLNRLSY
ncbi:hypothetical protein GCM10028809_27270 [Spirosoma gilvum]